ncbi:MAG: PopZ family protein [Allorhizobium sp.]
MAQPNVSREPSMEEILASIRRIIESNDPVGAPGMGGSLPPLYGGDDDDLDESVELDFDDGNMTGLEIRAANDIGHAEPRAPFFEQPAQQPSLSASPFEADRPVAKNISLADLAARVRSASERAELSGYAVRHELPPVPQDVAPMTALPMTAAAAPIPAPMQSPLMTGRMAELRRSEPSSALPVAAVAETPSADDEAVTDHAPAESPVQHSDVAEDAAPQALLSAAPGEQVARSFGELAAAIDGSQRRSLDEMAEEMLRPMLREWLDDNLPTLVERLVREEIERVARGPRR